MQPSTMADIQIEVMTRYKPGDKVIYYGSNARLYGHLGTIISKFGSDGWRVRLEDGNDIFAAEDDLQQQVQTFDFAD